MWSVVQKDAAGIAAVMTRMSTQRGPVDPAAVQPRSTASSTSTSATAASSGDFGAAITSILGTLYDNGLRLNQDFTLALKAIIQVEEITRILNPCFDILARRPCAMPANSSSPR